MVAGEYAVLKPGHRSILMAVDRYVKAELFELGTEKIEIKSSYHRHELSVSELLQNNVATKDFVLETITTFLSLLREGHQLLKGFRLLISSDLDSKEGQKYGLGSSAAVVVSLFRALNSFYETGLTNLEILKLSLITTWRVSPETSGADVAACTLEGWTLYRRPKIELVKGFVAQYGISGTIKKEWPGLTASCLDVPAELAAFVAWTKKPVKTSSQVAVVRDQNSDDSVFYETSEKAIDGMLQALEEKDSSSFLLHLKRSQTATLSWARKMGLDYQTEELKRAANIAKESGMFFKISGAGGGDCGIAFTNKNTDESRMFKEWLQAGVLPLKVTPLKCKELND